MSKPTAKGDTLKVSGKRFTLPEDATGWKFESRPGGWVIATDSSEQRHRIALAEFRGKLSYSIAAGVSGSQSGYGEVSGPVRAGAGGSAASIEADLTAQFPGKVRKILVSAGATVKEGEPLILVEAMKMEFAVKAPVAGKIKSIRVKEGQQLSPGDRFFDFEPEGKKTDG
jgi:biotin carboxyl carrier protein